MSFKTRLNPPPANGWVPPLLPQLADLVQPISAVDAKKSRGVESSHERQADIVAMQPRMPNLFEEAPRILFGEIERAEGPKAAIASVPMGRNCVNGKPAQFIGNVAQPNAKIEVHVVLDETGEVKKCVSPPVRVERE